MEINFAFFQLRKFNKYKRSSTNNQHFRYRTKWQNQSDGSKLKPTTNARLTFSSKCFEHKWVLWRFYYSIYETTVGPFIAFSSFIGRNGIKMGEMLPTYSWKTHLFFHLNIAFVISGEHYLSDANACRDEFYYCAARVIKSICINIWTMNGTLKWNVTWNSLPRITSHC